MMTRAMVANRLHCVPPLRSRCGGRVCWDVSVYLDIRRLGMEAQIRDGALGLGALLDFILRIIGSVGIARVDAGAPQTVGQV